MIVTRKKSRLSRREQIVSLKKREKLKTGNLFQNFKNRRKLDIGFWFFGKEGPREFLMTGVAMNFSIICDLENQGSFSNVRIKMVFSFYLYKYNLYLGNRILKMNEKVR